MLFDVNATRMIQKIDLNGKTVEEWTMSELNGKDARLIWVRDSKDLIAVEGRLNPCFVQRYSSEEELAKAREEVKELFLLYWSLPKDEAELMIGRKNVSLDGIS